MSSLLGGGVALLYATRVLDNIQTSNEDQKIGVQIIKNALKVPENNANLSSSLKPWICVFTFQFGYLSCFFIGTHFYYCFKCWLRRCSDHKQIAREK